MKVMILAWAEPYGCRTWAVESAGGWDCLLSQQLVAGGEDVLDVPPALAARVPLLGSGRSNENDPNDARSVAKRNKDLGRTRNRTACRLHALLAELVPGGMPGEISAAPCLPFEAGVFGIAVEQPPRVTDETVGEGSQPVRVAPLARTRGPRH